MIQHKEVISSQDKADALIFIDQIIECLTIALKMKSQYFDFKQYYSNFEKTWNLLFNRWINKNPKVFILVLKHILPNNIFDFSLYWSAFKNKNIELISSRIKSITPILSEKLSSKNDFQNKFYTNINKINSLFEKLYQAKGVELNITYIENKDKVDTLQQLESELNDLFEINDFNSFFIKLKDSQDHLLRTLNNLDMQIEKNQQLYKKLKTTNPVINKIFCIVRDIRNTFKSKTNKNEDLYKWFNNLNKIEQLKFAQLLWDLSTTFKNQLILADENTNK